MTPLEFPAGAKISDTDKRYLEQVAADVEESGPFSVNAYDRHRVDAVMLARALSLTPGALRRTLDALNALSEETWPKSSPRPS